MNEESLINGLINGDETAYKDLYEIYYEKLVAYGYNLTNDWSQAEDIVQNTLVNIWANRHKIIINTSLKSYLYRAVFNGFATAYKNEKRKQELLLQLKHEALNSLIEMDGEELEYKLKLLDAAIEQLPRKCKKIFLMNKKEGYKQREIAAYLDLSEKTIEKHISRAVHRIKESLQNQHSSVFILILNKVLQVKKQFLE